MNLSTDYSLLLFFASFTAKNGCKYIMEKSFYLNFYFLFITLSPKNFGGKNWLHKLRNSSLKIFKIFFSLFLVRKKIFVLFNKSYLQVIFIEILKKKYNITFIRTIIVQCLAALYRWICATIFGKLRIFLAIRSDLVIFSIDKLSTILWFHWLINLFHCILFLLGIR